MAKQVDNLTDSATTFEDFKTEQLDTMKAVLDNQNMMKQEMFLIRNLLSTLLSKPSPKPTEPVKDGLPANMDQSQPSPPPASKSPETSSGSMPSEPSSKSSSSRPLRDDKVSAEKTGSSQNEKILFVGDSILHNANFRVLEKVTKKTIHTAKAYAADYNLKTRKPNKNFKYVARNEAKKQEFEYAVLQNPSVHITNLNTSDNSEKGMDYLKKVAKDSSDKIIKVAEDLLKENKSIRKVILLDCIPRLDHRSNDPYEMRPKLAEINNNLNREQVAKSAFKDKIAIGTHNIATNEINYGNVNNRDGVHMHGRRGCESYTKSIIDILSKQMPGIKAPKHQNDTSSFPPRAPTTAQPMSSTGTSQTTPSPSTMMSPGPSVLKYAVKTFNRFSTFLQ